MNNGQHLLAVGLLVVIGLILAPFAGFLGGTTSPRLSVSWPAADLLRTATQPVACALDTSPIGSPARWPGVDCSGVSSSWRTRRPSTTIVGYIGKAC